MHLNFYLGYVKLNGSWLSLTYLSKKASQQDIKKKEDKN